MEIYSNTTRFALACNTSSKIIEPIQSRCAIVRFSKLGEKDILERLLYVCQHEKVCCPPASDPLSYQALDQCMQHQLQEYQAHPVAPRHCVLLSSCEKRISWSACSMSGSQKGSDACCPYISNPSPKPTGIQEPTF